MGEDRSSGDGEFSDLNNDFIFYLGSLITLRFRTYTNSAENAVASRTRCRVDHHRIGEHFEMTSQRCCRSVEMSTLALVLDATAFSAEFVYVRNRSVIKLPR